MDAFKIMMENGKKFKAIKTESWLDTGVNEELLNTNKALLEKKENQKILCRISDDIKIIPPVFIDGGVIIENSTIGPYVAIGFGSKIKNSKIENSIVMKNTEIIDSELKGSIIGNGAKIKGLKGKGFIGDYTNIG